MAAQINIDNSFDSHPVFSPEQLQIVEQAIENGLSDDEISILANPELEPGAMSELLSFIDEVKKIDNEDMQYEYMSIAKVLGDTNEEHVGRIPFTAKEIKSLKNNMEFYDLMNEYVQGVNRGKMDILHELSKEYMDGSLTIDLQDFSHIREGYVQEPEENMDIFNGISIPSDIEILPLPEKDIIEGQIEPETELAESKLEDNHVNKENFEDIYDKFAEKDEMESETRIENKTIPEEFLPYCNVSSEQELNTLIDDNAKNIQKKLHHLIPYLNDEQLQPDLIEKCIRMNIKCYAALEDKKKTPKTTKYAINCVKNQMQNGYLNNLQTHKTVENYEKLHSTLQQFYDSVPKKALVSHSTIELLNEIKNDPTYNLKEIQKQLDQLKENEKNRQETEKNTTEMNKNKDSAQTKKENSTKIEKENFRIVGVDTRPLPVRLWSAVKRFLYNAVAVIHNLFAKDKDKMPLMSMRALYEQKEVEKNFANKEAAFANAKEVIAKDNERTDSEKIKGLVELACKSKQTLECDLTGDRTIKIIPDGKNVSIFVGALMTGEKGTIRGYHTICVSRAKDILKDKEDIDTIIMGIRDKGRFDLVKNQPDDIFPVYTPASEKNENKVEGEKESPDGKLQNQDFIENYPQITKELLKKNELTKESVEEAFLTPAIHDKCRMDVFVKGSTGDFVIEKQDDGIIARQISEDGHFLVDEGNSEPKQYSLEEIFAKDDLLRVIDTSKFSVEAVPYYKNRIQENKTESFVFLNKMDNSEITVKQKGDVVLCTYGKTEIIPNQGEYRNEILLDKENVLEILKEDFVLPNKNDLDQMEECIPGFNKDDTLETWIDNDSPSVQEVSIDRETEFEDAVREEAEIAADNMEYEL